MLCFQLFWKLYYFLFTDNNPTNLYFMVDMQDYALNASNNIHHQNRNYFGSITWCQTWPIKCLVQSTVQQKQKDWKNYILLDVTFVNVRSLLFHDWLFIKYPGSALGNQMYNTCISNYFIRKCHYIIIWLWIDLQYMPSEELWCFNI